MQPCSQEYSKGSCVDVVNQRLKKIAESDKNENNEYLKARYKLSKYIRNFDKRGYIEVDTPIMVRAPTEQHLDYFETLGKDIHSKDYTLFLRSSPEIHLKSHE